MVTNEDVEQALACEDNKRIIQSVCRKYAGQLSSDELRTCGLNAVWAALENHDERYKTKFTSSLYRHVNWECLNAIKFNARGSGACELMDVPAKHQTDANDVAHILEKLTAEQQTLVRERFFLSMTLDEIGKAHGWTKQGAQQALNSIINELRMLFGVCPV